MRKVLLTLLVAALLAGPVSAQFRFTPTDPTGLLALESVQEALKLTDEQKKAIKEANEEFQKAFRSALTEQDLPALLKAQQEQVKAVKKVLDKLDDKQKARLAQIEYQASSKMRNPRTFANPHVQKALKLSDEQKKKIKESIAELDKDAKKLDEDAKDLKDWFSNFLKKGKANAEAFTKIVEDLNDDQKKALEKVGGEAIDLGGRKKDQ